MAWSTPPTWVAGQVITSAQLNILRDCLLETAPAKSSAASAAGSYFVGAGPSAIALRFASEAIVDTSETTTSTSYASVATNGPIISNAVTGTKALVWVTCQCSNSGTGSSVASYEVTGATTTSVADSWSVIVEGGAGNGIRASCLSTATLTAGLNTFRMLYRVSSGTGTFGRRRLTVMPL